MFNREPITVNVRNVDPDIWLRFRSEALLRNLPVGELLNQIMREWLSRKTKTLEQIAVTTTGSPDDDPKNAEVS